MKRKLLSFALLLVAGMLAAQCQVSTLTQIRNTITAGSLKNRAAMLEHNGFVKDAARSNDQQDVYRKCLKYEGTSSELYVETFFLGKGKNENQVTYEVWDMKTIYALKSQIMKPESEVKKDSVVAYRWGDSITAVIKKLEPMNTDLILSGYRFSFTYAVPAITESKFTQDFRGDGFSENKADGRSDTQRNFGTGNKYKNNFGFAGCTQGSGTDIRTTTAFFETIKCFRENLLAVREKTYHRLHVSISKVHRSSK